MTSYLSVEDILNLHSRTIKTHGGASGVRDLGLIQSSLYRCQSGYYETLCEQAAVLMQSFCLNHCFIDGNKRVALLSSITFLKLNGYSLKTTTTEIVELISVRIIQDKIGIPEITSWIESKISKD
ncbi:MAG: type II toxin-antitoxin system death-on-curing family toxin [Deltaproteobacteria bacterium]|nr:MAG: type II toxin-antitoxin system death-on-curing family toxin [Deltaproteobacteria bacterium]